MDMLFQMEKLDLTILRKRADLAILQALAARTQNKSLKFQADILAKEIKELSKTDADGMTLNEFINFIELSFNSIGMIDPDKMKAKRAFSLYHLAIESNKRKAKSYEKTNSKNYQ
jgi:hypothetical protein